MPPPIIRRYQPPHKATRRWPSGTVVTLLALVVLCVPTYVIVDRYAARTAYKAKSDEADRLTRRIHYLEDESQSFELKQHGRPVVGPLPGAAELADLRVRRDALFVQMEEMESARPWLTRYAHR